MKKLKLVVVAFLASLFIGANAFAGMDLSFSIICTQKSAAEQYARNHNVPFQIVV